MRQITVNDLDALAIGASILGTGGGGDPFIGKLMAQQAIEENETVTLINPEELDDDALVVPVCMLGAPTVTMEKIPEGMEIVRALRGFERYIGRKADAISPIECGGINSLIPFLLAAHTKIPVLDGDGMGRAFPEFQMVTFHLHNILGSPATMADERGSIVTIEASNNYELEQLVRSVTTCMGGHSSIINYQMSGKTYKRTAVKRTVTMALVLGEAVLNARAQHINPIEAICEVTQNTIYGRGIILFKGKVIDVVRKTSESFVRGHVVLQGLNDWQGSQLRVEFQNENLVAICNNRIIASVPDLICLLDSEVGTSVTTERLRYGQRIVALGIPAPEILRSIEALQIWGPQVFGYDLSFIPLEILHQDYYRRYGVMPEKGKYLK